MSDDLIQDLFQKAKLTKPTTDGVNRIPVITEMEHEALIIKLAQLMEWPVETLTIIQRCDRMFYCEYQLKRHPDPFIFLSLVNFGPGYRELMKQYAWRISNIRQHNRTDYVETLRIADRLLAQLDRYKGKLTFPEWDFAKTKIQLMSAYPA